MLRLLISPRLIGLHLLAVVAVAAAGWLGWWQYGAWQVARAAEATDLAGARPVSLSDALGPDEPFPGDVVGRPVRFTGRWVGEGSFLVPRGEAGERTGSWVVTPVAVCGTSCSAAPAILVVRGRTDGHQLPVPPSGRVRVTGWLQPPEDSGRPDTDPADDVLPEVSVADAIQLLDRDLYGGYVIAREVIPRGVPSSSSSAEALEPVTPASLPEPGSFTSLRNLLYALEWWVFGGFALFVWWRWCRDVTTSEEPGVGATWPVSSQDASSPTENQVGADGVASKP